MCSYISRCCRWLTAFYWRPDPFNERNIRISKAISALSKIIENLNKKLSDASELSELLKGMINLSKDSYSQEQKNAASKMDRVIREAGLLQLKAPLNEGIPSPGSWWFSANRPIAFDPRDSENVEKNLKIIEAVTALSKTVDHFTQAVADATEKQENYIKLYYQQKVDPTIEQSLLSEAELSATIRKSSGIQHPFLPYTGPVSKSGALAGTMRKGGEVPRDIKPHKEAIEKELKAHKHIGSTTVINTSWHNLEHRKLMYETAIGELSSRMSREEIEKALPYLSQELYNDLKAIGITR